MEESVYNEYLERYLPVIKGIARKLSADDLDLWQDLVQEGRIKLWKLDPRKAKTNEDAWIRQALNYGMVSYLRKVRPDRYSSLDEWLEAGWQLEEMPSGQRYLHPSSRRQMSSRTAETD